MKRHHLTRVALIGATAMWLAPAATAQSSDTSSASASQRSGAAGSTASYEEQSKTTANTEIQRATDRAEDRKLGDLTGKQIVGSDGNELGKVNDFLIEPQSGRIHAVVVSTGGVLGLGDKLRVLDAQKLKAGGANSDALLADSDQETFNALAVVSESQLDSGQFEIGATAQTSTNDSNQPAGASAADRGADSSSLARASEIKGKHVNANGTDAGEIDDVVIRLERGQAMALFDPNDNFARVDGKFLVPFAKLDFGSPTGDTLGTSLTRADFPAEQTAQVSSSDVGGSLSSGQASLWPTGRDSTAAVNDTPASSDRDVANADSSQSSNSTAMTADGESNPNSSSVADTGSSGRDQQSGSSDRIGSSADQSSSATSTASRSASGAVASSGSAGTTSTSDASNSTQNSVAATSRDDEASRAAASGSASDSGANSALTPTGRTSADQFQGDPALASVAQKIRSELDQDSTLGKADIRVTSSNGKIVLEGSVDDEDAKSRASEIAHRALIENELEVNK